MNVLSLRAGVAVATALAAFAAPAADDHDHDAAPAQAAVALPRFAAVSASFELVGILKGRQLTVYLDRFADNEPVRGAAIELEVGGTRIVARAHDDGDYEATLPAALAPGVTAITATVVAAGETDLLVGEIRMAEEPHDEAAHAWPWRTVAALAAGLLAVTAAVAWAVRRTAVCAPRGPGAAT